MPDSASVLGQAQQQYGVQAAQDNVNRYKALTQNLTGAIAAVDPSVTGRTSGSLVTEGQRGALVDREKAPIISNLGTANEGLSDATTDYNTDNQNAKDSAASTIADATAKYNQLKDTYDISNTQEQQKASAAQTAADAAEKAREFNVSAAQSGSSSNNPAAGYSVKQLSSGNLAYTGPDGSATNLYQYAQALNGGNSASPDAVLGTIKQELSQGSTTDKGAAAGIAALQKQGLSTSQIIARLKASNGYIFN